MENIEEVNIINFQTIIENYEGLIGDLSNDLRYFKSEHIHLQGTVKSLLEENKRLSKEVKDLRESKEKSSISVDNDDLVQNLKQQIEALISEKEYITKLWQNSIRTIDFLEDELKVFQAGSQKLIARKDVLKMKQDYEEKISSLEASLTVTQKKLEDVEKNASKELGAKIEEVDKSLQTQTGAFMIVKNLEEEVLSLQKRLQDSEKMKMRLEKALKSKEDSVESTRRENADCRVKVKEAVELVTAALNEKDAALYREKEARDAVEKINQEISGIIRETEEKVKSEVARVQIECNVKYEQLLKDLKIAQDEIAAKHLEIEKFSTKCLLLENEIEKIQRGNFSIDDSKTSKLLILEKNFESTFQKLLASEKQNIQLLSERDGIRSDMDQMATHYERTLKTKEVEKATLQNRVKQLQLELDESNTNLIRLTEKLENVNNKIGALEKSYQLQIEDRERSLNQSCADKIETIQASCDERVKEMQFRVDSLLELNKKWKSESKSIIGDLEKVIVDLKAEVDRLQKENKKLKDKWVEGCKKIEQYKKFLLLISNDVTKISDMAQEHENG